MNGKYEKYSNVKAHEFTKQFILYYWSFPWPDCIDFFTLHCIPQCNTMWPMFCLVPLLRVTWPYCHFHIKFCRIDLGKYYTTALLVIKIKIKKYGQCFHIKNGLLNCIRDTLLRAIYICIYMCSGLWFLKYEIRTPTSTSRKWLCA